MNRERMTALRHVIAGVPPEACDMSDFLHGSVSSEEGKLVPAGCGTTGCIAGWAVALRDIRSGVEVVSDDDPVWDDAVDAEAAEWLGLATFDGGYEGPECPLFYVSMWPAKFVDIQQCEGDRTAMLAILDALLAGTLSLNPDTVAWQGVDA